MEQVATPDVSPSVATARRTLAGLFWLIASLLIMLASVTLWAHQTLLTSDGWSGIVAGVASDPEVVEATSVVVVDRVSDRLGVEERIAGILPGELGLVAGVIAGNLEERVARGVADFAMRPEVQDAFVRVNAAAHSAAMRVIRGGEGGALSSEDGAISLNVFPLIEGALASLQEAGLIDAGREIPDLSEYEPPAETVARLEALLGRDLPDDIGTITLIDSERLGRVQDAVRSFDLITIGVTALAVLCIGLALWLSSRRLRMVLWLALGAVVALGLARAFTRAIVEDITGSLRDGPAGVTVRAVVESSIDSLMLFTFAVIAAGIVVAGVALWYERRSRRAEASSGARRGLRAWLRDEARTIAWVGLGIVALVVLWQAAGPDLALLAASAAGAWLIAVSILASPEDAEAQGAAAPDAPGGAGTSGTGAV